jgi:FixJ family two-component response regulator
MRLSKEDRMIELLEELVKWTRVTSIPNVKKLLLEILTSPEEKIAYQLSDGKSSKEVAKQADVSYVTITFWWKKWIKAGIAEPVRARGGSRARRIFSLDDFGIGVS